MFPRIRITLGVAVAALLLGLPSLTRQLGITSAQSPTALGGVVVLRSGQVLQGEVTRIDQRYVVRMSEGNELRIAAADVEFVADSLEDAGRRKAARIRPGVLDDHLQLAEWCLRHGQIRQAVASTTEALRLAPDDPRVKSLERRLNSLVPSTHEDEPAPEASVERRSAAQLDQALRDLPPGAVQRFTTSVHPLLLNRCATSGCHGPRGTAEYRLLRPALGQTPTRRMTQQNLLATLAWIDRDRPDDSSLLDHAKSVHGNATKPAHAALEQGQYELLVDWVRQATLPAGRIRPTTIDGADPKLLQTNAKSTAPEATSEAEPASDSTDRKGASPRRHGEERPRTSTASQNAAPGAATAAGAPATIDPFDPEVFNRRRPRN